jgi:DNA-binding CsgD family transcriptional regulator
MREPVPNLTPRQTRVRDLVSSGLSSKQISAILGISPRTVESHRDAIYRKYGVRNAVQLIRKIFSGGV